MGKMKGRYTTYDYTKQQQHHDYWFTPSGSYEGPGWLESSRTVGASYTYTTLPSLDLGFDHRYSSCIAVVDFAARRTKGENSELHCKAKVCAPSREDDTRHIPLKGA